MWKTESDKVRAMWIAKAEKAKLEHAKLYPGYSYKPRKTTDVKRRMTKGKVAALAALKKNQKLTMITNQAQIQTRYQYGKGTSATNPNIMQMYPIHPVDPMMRQFDLPTGTAAIEEFAHDVAVYNTVQGLAPQAGLVVLQTSFSNATNTEYEMDKLVVDPLTACTVEEMEKVLSANAATGNVQTGQVQPLQAQPLQGPVFDYMFARNFDIPPPLNQPQLDAAEAKEGDRFTAEQLRQQRLHDDAHTFPELRH
jgi:hypothetical protein